MSIPRILCLAISALLIPGGAVTAATVTYDGGSWGGRRAVSVVGIDINSILYDVTITYNNNAATNPLRVGSLPDADIPLAVTGLADLLNTQSVDSYHSYIFFQPNVDILAPEAHQMDGNWIERHGEIKDLTEGTGQWETSVAIYKHNAPNNSFNEYAGFAQFAPSIVPEPSAIAGCLGLVGMGLLIGWRRKSNRKKK